MDAYENMDPDLMVQMTADTVKFHPADIPGTFDVDMTNTNFIVERQSGWDSISKIILHNAFENGRFKRQGCNYCFFRNKI